MQKTTIVAEQIISSANIIRRVINEKFFQNKMTATQFLIMRAIKSSPGGKTIPKDLMKFCSGTKSNLSQRINALEDGGLISRLPHKKGDDRRKVFVELTQNGKILFSKMFAEFEKACNEKTVREEVSKFQLNPKK